MKILRIGVIDEIMDLHTLQELIGYSSDRITINSKINVSNHTNISSVSHGTLCTALLLEALHKYQIADNVHVTHFSVTDNSGEKSFALLLEALRYCVANSFNIVSMSIGLLGFGCVRDLNSVLSCMESTIVVAAASNRFALTYPAALPQVIGVKRKLKNTGTGSIEWINDPADGIELVVDLPDTPIIRKLREQYSYWIGESNSVLVPQICGEIAKAMVHGTKISSKEAALKCIAKVPRNRLITDYILPYVNNVDSEELTPVVMVPYDFNTKRTVFDLAVSLQQKFEEEDYHCTILSDIHIRSDFLHRQYALDASYQNTCLTFYQRIIPDGLILILVSSDNPIRPACNLCIEHGAKLNVSDLYSEIMKYFA